ncbi:hypothetical protein DPMN_190839 [Dreissena polymorpha]|uniref:Uncharacterized protein n=1 Tax=Dreissena polymorpha TaxID=45954 RepID=A0A9D4BBE0_DREPO|nr:hypothetical protein DPMN_190839 [Dreissena polymorpha]
MGLKLHLLMVALYQPVHQHSLFRSNPVCIKVTQGCVLSLVVSVAPDQAVQVRRLIFSLTRV